MVDNVTIPEATTQAARPPLVAQYREGPHGYTVSDEMGIPDWMRDLLLNERQTLLMRLGAIEDALKMERSVLPKRKRQG